MEIKVFAQLSPERLYDAGIRAGLSEEAADYFRYFSEVPMTLRVVEKTGEVVHAEIDPALWEGKL